MALAEKGLWLPADRMPESIKGNPAVNSTHTLKGFDTAGISYYLDLLGEEITIYCDDTKYKVYALKICLVAIPGAKTEIEIEVVYLEEKPIQC